MLRLFVAVLPTAENTLSDEADVAGTAGYAHTTLYNVGNFILGSFVGLNCGLNVEL